MMKPIQKIYAVFIFKLLINSCSTHWQRLTEFSNHFSDLAADFFKVPGFDHKVVSYVLLK
jgi:hypothetical protein